MSTIDNPNGVWKDRIVKAGHGEYNSVTGEFQFLPACNKGKIMTTTFETAKVGDKVWDFLRGWGEVTSVSEAMRVVFSNGDFKVYLLDGTDTSRYPRTLFWDEIKFEVPSKPMAELEVDTKVHVWNNGDEGDKQKRYFSHFKNCKIYCFDRGQTSWTTNSVYSWDNWELADERD